MSEWSLQESLLIQNFPLSNEIVWCDQSKSVVFNNITERETFCLHGFDIIKINNTIALLEDDIAVVEI